MSEYQTKIQPEKSEAIKSLKDDFQEVKDFIFTDYRGLTVEQITELRTKLRANNATYKVVKNRFAKIALSDLEKADAGKYLVGPTAVALSANDTSEVAKTLLEFAKNSPMEVKGGIVDGFVFNAAQIEALSKLPTRMELIASLMGTMMAPVQNVVYLLNAIPTKLVRTLQAVADAKAGK